MEVLEMIKWFKNLKIGVRILIGFLLVAVIACAIGCIGILSLQQVNGSYKVAYTDSVDALKYVERISSSFQRIRMNVYGVVLADTRDDKEYHIERIDNFQNVINENLAKYNEMLSSYKVEQVETGLQSINDVQTSLEAYSEKMNVFVNGIAMDTDRYEEAYELLGVGGEINNSALAVDDAITELVNYNIDYAAKQITANGNQASGSIMLMLIGVAIGVILAIITGLYISRGISKPIGLLVEAADAIALGDVNIKVQATTKDEVGVLMKSFAEMAENIRDQALAVEQVANADLEVEVTAKSEKDLMGKSLSKLINGLNEIITNIASASEQVAAGAKQISASSMALSQGATEQASSIEELTASIEEISSQTKLNTENANQANELAETAKSNAAEGNNQMKEMVVAMEEINESSNNISKIIKVIDDIAFQTNMLSLNAAVEAARAGQHGKGFAVVAEEVKNLAARSANAAKETTEMIEGSIRKTEIGTKIAKDTAEALNNIVDEIEKVAALVNDIAVASNEQYAGISQINQGIMQISQVVQNNSATSEEGAAASEELSSQAEVLNELVAKFKLKKNSKTYGKIEELSPEVLKMLEDMSQKGKANSSEIWDSSEKETAANPKIALSDKEFGKY
jgi:methyl-accepting chemotaxis protein